MGAVQVDETSSPRHPPPIGPDWQKDVRDTENPSELQSKSYYSEHDRDRTTTRASCPAPPWPRVGWSTPAPPGPARSFVPGGFCAYDDPSPSFSGSVDNFRVFVPVLLLRLIVVDSSSSPHRCSASSNYTITLLQKFNNCARHARSQTTDITDHHHLHEGQLVADDVASSYASAVLVIVHVVHSC